MDAYIVRQPIINKLQKVYGYEMVYRQDSSVLYNQNDATVAEAVISFFNDIDGDKFMNGKMAFMTFTPNLLMRKIPKIFDNRQIVIQIEDNILVNKESVDILKDYQELGYRMAVIGFDFYNRFLDILPCVEYIKVDFSKEKRDIKIIRNIIEIAKKLDKKTIAYNVNTPEERGKALVYGFDYVQGESVAEMMETKVHKTEKLDTTFFRLMTAITRPLPDFQEIERIVSMDVSMTFSLLKMVNSAYFALPRHIKDVKQALTILGIDRLRQWIYLMSFLPDGGMTDELVRTSFLRAVFCQKIAERTAGFPIKAESAYLLGMFSTLDVLLEVPMEDAVSKLPLADELKAGLNGLPGNCNDLIQLCAEYEKGRWNEMTKYAANLNVKTDIIAKTYYESIGYVNDIWNDLLESRFLMDK